MADQIADMLTRIRNANSERQPRVDVPWSSVKENIARILETEGYIRGFKTVELANPRGRVARPFLRLNLKYGPQGQSVVNGLKRVSRAGRRVYSGKDETPSVLAGLGTSILTTSKGLMTGRDAAKAGVGGEALCDIW